MFGLPAQFPRRYVTDRRAGSEPLSRSRRNLIAWLEALVLGLVQGITEFLPVSSDGHLLLTQSFFAWLTGQGHSGKENLFFDVILHLGTTAAILVYHRSRSFKVGAGSGASGCPARLSPS